MENNYKLSFKTADSLRDIKERINQAKISIDIEIFYFIEDNIGSEILTLLIEKAKQGLKIRLLVDHVGSFEFAKSKTLSVLKDYNIKVLFFNSLLPFTKNSKSIWYFRNHRRTIIVDNEYVFTGGICIGQPALDWIDLGIFIKDKYLANKGSVVFNQTWNNVYHPTFNIGSISRTDLELSNNFNYITQSPLQFKRHIYKYYLRSIKKSKEEVCFISPYFVPNRKFIRDLIEASKRHINISIIIPKKTDWVIVDLARNTFIHRLLKNGINVYFHEKMIHSKFTVFDKKEAYIGTRNLDNLSLRYNYENGVKILDQNCILELNNHIKNDLLPQCVKLNLKSWDNRGLFLKTLEKLVWIIRGFL